MVAAAKKGGPLTPEEKATVKAQIQTQINAELYAKMKKVVDAVDDSDTSATPPAGQ